MWGDDDYRHCVNSNPNHELLVIWSEVLQPHDVREHECQKILQAWGVQDRQQDTLRSCAAAGPVWGAARATGLENKQWCFKLVLTARVGSRRATKIIGLDRAGGGKSGVLDGGLVL